MSRKCKMSCRVISAIVGICGEGSSVLLFGHVTSLHQRRYLHFTAAVRMIIFFRALADWTTTGAWVISKSTLVLLPRKVKFGGGEAV